MGRLDGAASKLPGSREANENLRHWIHLHDDEAAEQRTVLHYAYPQQGAGPQARALLARELQKRGFAVSDAALRNGFVFQHEAIVASDQFDAITRELAELLQSYDWDYDAWECGPEIDPALTYWRKLENLPLQ